MPAIKRTKDRFVLGQNGTPKKLPDDIAGQLDKLPEGFSVYVALSKGENGALSVRRFNAPTLIEALRELEPGTFLGMPIGRHRKLGTVFLVARVPVE